MLGPMTNGSDNIQPHKHQTMALKKFAVTSGPGIDRLLFDAKTAGTVTSMDKAPKKLQNDAINPVRNNARSPGNTTNADDCNNTKAATTVK
mmetsp:Transcript_43288/g.86000  ORF Transcript_43288/g.86000 Transcript_43288/m.86000 type:complete len:91 (+) Transcript_43288:207-479(+)